MDLSTTIEGLGSESFTGKKPYESFVSKFVHGRNFSYTNPVGQQVSAEFRIIIRGREASTVTTG